MRAKILVYALAALILTTIHLAEAQQPGKIPWIGYLAGAGSGPSPAFIQGLRDLGYVEGKNIAFVFRTTEGKTEHNADLAAELVRLKVDIIVADSTGIALALKKATSTIPIVMTTVTDPVGTGLVASLARPGGNVTGLTSISGELGGKLLEILKESVPRLNRVAILRPAGAANDLFVRETEPSARALGVKLIPLVFQDLRISRTHFDLQLKREPTVLSPGLDLVLLPLTVSGSWS
jgi:putative ABC transport system substrate-binding protein